MYRVSEIDRRRPARQHDHPAERRERVDLLRVEVHFQSGKEVARIAHLPLPLDKLPQPRNALVFGARPFASFFVFPVRGNAFLGNAVHLFRPDLRFECDAAGSDHRSMQRLVQIRPGNRNKIFDAPGNGMPFVVNDSQRRIAVLHRVRNDPNRQQIIHLVKSDPLPFQLQIDGIGALHPPMTRAGMFSRASSCSICV